MDYSESVVNQEHYIADAFEAFINRFELSEVGIRISAVVFNSDAYTISNLTSDKKVLIAGAHTIRVNQANGFTNLSSALYKANSEFRYSARDGVKKSLIIISDGKPTNLSVFNCKTVIRNMKKSHADLSVFGIFINNNDDAGEDFMQSISDFYVSTSYEILVQELERLDMCF